MNFRVIDEEHLKEFYATVSDIQRRPPTWMSDTVVDQVLQTQSTAGGNFAICFPCCR